MRDVLSQEIEEKIERLVRVCSEQALGGLLINSQPNFSWLTAGGTNGVNLSTEAGVATLLVLRDGRRFVLASRIEIARMMTEELAGQGYEPVEFGWEEEKANPVLLAELARTLMSDQSPLGSDVFLGQETRFLEGAIARARYKLTAPEIDRFKALGKDAGTVIGEVAQSVSPGLSEREVARRVNNALAAIGANSVVTLVAADERLGRFRHPVPTDQRWQKVLMIVVCARRRGLIASLTRIVCAGRIPEDLKRRTQATAQVNAQVLPPPGRACPDLSFTKWLRTGIASWALRGKKTYTTKVAQPATAVATGWRIPGRPSRCRSVRPLPGTPQSRVRRSRRQASLSQMGSKLLQRRRDGRASRLRLKDANILRLMCYHFEKQISSSIVRDASSLASEPQASREPRNSVVPYFSLLCATSVFSVSPW